MMTTRRTARKFRPAVDGLEARKLLSTVAIKHTPPFVAQGIQGTHIGFVTETGSKMTPAVVTNPTHTVSPVSATSTSNRKGTTNYLTAPIKSDLNPQPLPPGVRPEEPKNWI